MSYTVRLQFHVYSFSAFTVSHCVYLCFLEFYIHIYIYIYLDVCHAVRKVKLLLPRERGCTLMPYIYELTALCIRVYLKALYVAVP